MAGDAADIHATNSRDLPDAVAQIAPARVRRSRLAEPQRRQRPKPGNLAPNDSRVFQRV